MINTENLNLLALQTGHMRADPTTRALCYALDRQIKKLRAAAERLAIITNISTQEDEVLDALAWQYHVDEYDAKAPLEVKRRLIQQAVIVHKYRGTVYACEEVISSVFGPGTDIEEWFDYGGRPKHYRVVSGSPGVVADNYRQFLTLISQVGRVGVVLDAIQIALQGQLNTYVGMTVREYSRERYVMGEEIA